MCIRDRYGSVTCSKMWIFARFCQGYDLRLSPYFGILCSQIILVKRSASQVSALGPRCFKNFGSLPLHHHAILSAHGGWSVQLLRRNMNMLPFVSVYNSCTCISESCRKHRIWSVSVTYSNSSRHRQPQRLIYQCGSRKHSFTHTQPALYMITSLINILHFPWSTASALHSCLAQWCHSGQWLCRGF